jgi:hypothetical protein
MVFADPTGVISGLISQTDVLLVNKSHLGIRDKGGQKDCMSGSTLRAFDPADTKTKFPLIPLYRAFIVTVDRKAGGVSAGTG